MNNGAPVTSAISSYNNAVTPSDTNTLEDDFGTDKRVTKGIAVTVPGDVALVFADDADAITLSLGVGEYAYAVKQIKSTGTTATGIYALY